MPIPTTPISQLTVRHTSSASVHNIPYAIVDGTDRATTLRLEFMNAGGTTIQSVVLLDPGGTDKPLVKQAGKLSLVAGRPNAWIYTLADADHPTAGTYTIQITFSNVVSLIARVETWSGVTQAGLNTADSLGAPTPVEGSGPAASITVASEVGGLVLDCLDVYGTGTVTLAPGAGQTSDNNDTLPNIGAGGTSHTAGAASVVMSWSLSGQLNWVYCAIALAPASTNTPPTVEIDEKASIGSAIYLPVGASIQLHAKITDPDPADAGLTPSWSSDTPAVATVDASTGVVTAVAEGQAVITASTTDTAGASGSDTITILVDNSPATGGTTILGDDMKSQELREAGVDTTVNVALYDATGNQLTTNPVVAGDITISINNAAPTTLVGNAGLGALVMVNGLLPIPLDATELPTAGDRVTLLIQDQDGTAYRTRSIEILVFGGDPAVPETSTDIKLTLEASGGKLDTLTTRVDVASSTLATPAQVLAQVNAALVAYGAAKPADLPPDPDNAGIAAIQAVTDALTVINGAVGASLSSAERDAIANAMLDLAAAIDGKTLRQVFRLLSAFWLGAATDLNTTNPQFSAMDGSKVRVTGAVSGSTRTPTLDAS